MIGARPALVTARGAVVPTYARAISTSTSSPTLASASLSAALLTPTQKPPPATSMALPLNVVPAIVPPTRYWRRPPSVATSSAGASTTASPPPHASSHQRTLAVNRSWLPPALLCLPSTDPQHRTLPNRQENL